MSDQTLTVDGVSVPRLLYGTAWSGFSVLSGGSRPSRQSSGRVPTSWRSRGSEWRPFEPGGFPMVTLETDRLTLRMLRESDIDAYAGMCGDPEVMRFIGDGQPLARPMAWRNLATMVGHWTLRGYGLWAVEERATGVFVGRIGFWNPEGWPGFELGWTLRRAFWGKGYAAEGARAALRFAFTQLNQPHVISLIHPENAASIRVADRLGERRVDSTEVFGKPALVYRITREEWEGRSEP